MDIFSSLIGILAIITLAVGVVGSLVCFVLVLIQMFRRDQQTLALVCIATSLLAGVGTIVAFIVGWLKAVEWQIKRTMIVWSVFQVLQLFGLLFVTLAMIGYFQARMKQELDKIHKVTRPRVHSHDAALICYTWRR